MVRLEHLLGEPWWESESLFNGTLRQGDTMSRRAELRSHRERFSLGKTAVFTTILLARRELVLLRGPEKLCVPLGAECVLWVWAGVTGSSRQ
jgi:hypothetical protein